MTLSVRLIQCVLHSEFLNEKVMQYQDHKTKQKSMTTEDTLKRLKDVCFWTLKLRTLSWSTRSKYISFPICIFRSSSRAT